MDRLRRLLVDPPADLEARIGRYEVAREIARGGMSVVYEAYDASLDRSVAIKVMLVGNIARLRREAMAAARLRHPNIVAVHEVGPSYIVMDYVAGTTLAEALPRLPLAERVRILAQVARAVDFAHGQGVAHRDLKPANILLEEGTGRVVLTDFGLAKLDKEDDLTLTGSVLGTPQYMAPEQVRGQRAAAPADVWALGVLLYELASDRRPFEGETPLVVYDAITRQEPRAPRGPLGAIAARALEKDPARRYPSAGAMADDLDRYLAGAPVKRRLLSGRRRRWAVRAVAGAAVAGGGVAAWWWAVRSAVDGSAGDPLRAIAAEERAFDERLTRTPNAVEALLGRSQARALRAEYGRTRGRDPMADYAAAEADLDRALALAPGDPETLMRRGRVRAQRIAFLINHDRPPEPGACDAAEADLTGAFPLPAARTWRSNLRFHCALAARKTEGEAALRARLEAAIADLEPASLPDAVARRGRILAHLGRFADADADFRRAQQAQPPMPSAWLWQGAARLAAGDAAGAEAALGEALRLDEHQPEAWEQRGHARGRRGNTAGAVADWERAMSLDPALEPRLRPLIAKARRR